jgi:hypothetical protein
MHANQCFNFWVFKINAGLPLCNNREELVILIYFLTYGICKKAQPLLRPFACLHLRSQMRSWDLKFLPSFSTNFRVGIIFLFFWGGIVFIFESCFCPWYWCEKVYCVLLVCGWSCLYFCAIILVYLLQLVCYEE